MSFFVRHHLHVSAILLLGMLALSGCADSSVQKSGGATWEPGEEEPGNEYDPQPEPDPVSLDDHMLSVDVALSLGLTLVEEPLMLRSESGASVRLERDETGVFTGSISALPGETLFFVIPVDGGDAGTELLATVIAGIYDDEDGDDAGRVSCNGACEFGVLVPRRPDEEIVLSVSVFGPVEVPTKRAR